MTWTRARTLDAAAQSSWDPLDLSLGVPFEPAPRWSGDEDPPSMARYPLCSGSDEFRAAAVRYLHRRFRVTVPVAGVAACAGGKEFIASLPSLLRMARPPEVPERDIALIPALGYPPYEFGARLAGLRTHRVPVDPTGRIDLVGIPDQLAQRALYLWVNSPANPTGVIEPDLAAITAWGRKHSVIILSDEAYAELSWAGPPATMLTAGLDGVLAVHSVSKRSNAPGLRVGFFAGDPGLVAELVPLRREAGLIAAENSQRQAAGLLDDDTHVAALQQRTRSRINALVEILQAFGLECVSPQGGLFLWVAAPEGDGLRFAADAAAHAGLVVAAGEFYGPSGHPYVRIAAVHTADLVEPRLAVLADRGLVPGSPVTPEPDRKDPRALKPTPR